MNKPLFRIIVPKFPNINIYTRAAKTTTDLGSVMLASVVNKMWDWRVEVINENNYHGPKDKNGMPDHEVLQRNDPAVIVGLCCGLSCTMERVWQLAAFYKAREIPRIAGGWHAHYCPEETLRHDINLVVHGDGEPVIRAILTNFEKDLPLGLRVPGVSYLWALETCGGKVCHNNQKGYPLEYQIPDMDKGLVTLRNEMEDLNDLPYPDFGLLKYAKLKVYPIGRTRGCGYNCEFCSVKGGVHSANAQHLFRTVNWLVDTRGAARFFIVDDRLEQDLEQTIEFFRLIKERYGDRLNFLVQVRLESAKNEELVKAMAEAGVRTVCVGYESPIDEDLKAMRKGITSANMLEWTEILGRHFWIHAMFIFGYPPKDEQSALTAKEMEKRFKSFIRKAVKATHWHGFSIQVLKAMPIIGTELRRRLEKDEVLFPLPIVPWRYHDGNWAAFMPKNMTLQDFQETPIRIMNWFYSPFSFIRVCLRTVVFPIDYLFRGWRRWKAGWRRDIVKTAGAHLVKEWREKQDPKILTGVLQEYWDNRPCKKNDNPSLIIKDE
jgi:radical SAM superfamily enzyme YgiQ (UPF0313 family)